MDDGILITDELIRAQLETKRGGFTKETLTALGISWPPAMGWKSRLIGFTISKAQWQKAVDGKLRRAKGKKADPSIPSWWKSVTFDGTL